MHESSDIQNYLQIEAEVPTKFLAWQWRVLIFHPLMHCSTSCSVDFVTNWNGEEFTTGLG